MISARTVELSAPPEGWHHLATSILLDGALARLQADADVYGDFRRSIPPHQSNVAALPLWLRDVNARIVVTRHDGEHIAVQFELDAGFPIFDRPPDGSWVVVNTRCAVGEDNADIYAPDGTALSEFCLGDGIAHLQCDGQGRIWCGYYDEGVFGNLGWGEVGAPAPIGGPGVVAFDTQGVVQVEFEPFKPWPSMISCSALNVGDVDAWLTYSPDSPLVHMSDGENKIRSSGMSRVSAVIVAEDDVLVVGKREGDHETVVTFRRRFDDSNAGSELERLSFLVGRIARGAEIVGRKDMLHIIEERRWLSLSAGDLVRLADVARAD